MAEAQGSQSESSSSSSSSSSRGVDKKKEPEQAPSRFWRRVAKVVRLWSVVWAKVRLESRKARRGTKLVFFVVMLAVTSALLSHSRDVRSSIPQTESVVASRVSTSEAATAAKLAETAALPQEVAWSEFVKGLKMTKGSKGVSEVTVGPNRYEFVYNNEPFFARPLPGSSGASEAVNAAIDRGITVMAAPVAAKKGGAPPVAAIIACVYIAFVIAAMRQISGGGVGNVGKMANPNGKNRRKYIFFGPRRQSSRLPDPNIATFDEIAGVNGEARKQVEDLRDLVQNAQKYATVGARAPKGVLLVGPPGTGKTLLARALANEARVPFIYCTGSDFVEIFAGRGAARVRQLFNRAKKLGRCIIFIDELDAVGRARRDGMVSFNSNDEQEQTLNQLLAAMDGIDQNTGIVVLAATNRIRILDAALVRPGRFDRVVRIEPPDLLGRIDILRIHARKLQLEPELLLDDLLAPIAFRTPGLVGADLAAIVNEAAICAARDDRANVNEQDFNDALDIYLRARSPSPLDTTSNPIGFLFNALLNNKPTAAR